MREKFTILKKRLDVGIRKFVEKHTSFRNTFAGLEIGNVLVALSTISLMGVGSLPFSIPIIIFLSFILILIGVVGKYIDEVGDDKERLKLYEEHLKEFLHSRPVGEDSPCSYSCSVCYDCVQSSNDKTKGLSDRDFSRREQRVETEDNNTRESTGDTRKTGKGI